MADEEKSAADTAKAKKEPHVYAIDIAWDGDGTGAGVLRPPDNSFTISIGGSTDLGGCGRGANPEQLLLAAIGSCFISTWAIFLKKLAIPYAEPSLSLRCSLAADPAGGFKVEKIEISCAVPQSLLESRRPEVEKTVKLAEKYCIISKVARAAMPVEVSIRET
ncbi:MAG: OsmC family protein [Thermoanaerobaculia bacterium]